jgi:hypothetical protein
MSIAASAALFVLGALAGCAEGRGGVGARPLLAADTGGVEPKVHAPPAARRASTTQPGQASGSWTGTLTLPSPVSYPVDYMVLDVTGMDEKGLYDYLQSNMPAKYGTGWIVVTSAQINKGTQSVLILMRPQ